MTFSLGPACACGHPVDDHDDLGCTVVEDAGVCMCLVEFDQEPERQ